MANPEEGEKVVLAKTYDYHDLQGFQNQNTYTSIGKMQVSNKTSAPSYGFGTSSRQKQAKVYQSEELSRTQFVGKTSPGPNYEVRDTDKFTYKNDPSWSLGKEVRNTLNTGPKHAHYTRQDVDFDPITAHNSTKWNQGATKIGLASRFTDDAGKYKNTPGPEYDPNVRPEIPNAPKFSLGIRRDVKGASPLILMASTPNIVGPGSYIKQGQGNTSTMADHPEFSFPKDPKFKAQSSGIQKNQTYDTRSSMGAQTASTKKSMAQVSFGKAKKDYNTGTFKSMMAKQPVSLRIPHPRY